MKGNLFTQGEDSAPQMDSFIHKKSMVRFKQKKSIKAKF